MSQDIEDMVNPHSSVPGFLAAPPLRRNAGRVRYGTRRMHLGGLINEYSLAA